MKKVIRYFIRGYRLSWGAKHYWEKKFGPFLSKEEMRKIGGAHIICGCESEKGAIQLYRIKVPFTTKFVELEKPFVVGYEGYDVALLDPWEQNPREHYEKNYSETTQILLEDDIPYPCKECREWERRK
jgi:hypothetical protein